MINLLKNINKQKIIAIILAIMMILPVLPAITVSAAVSGITYYEYNFELPLYGATGCLVKDIGGIPAGTAFTIIEEQGANLKVKLSNGVETTVSKIFCMINLPDVVPSIIYNITSSYSSVIKALGNPIPGITGQSLYQNGTSKKNNPRLGKQEFLVPVLYNTAIKIAAAQKKALADDYTLVIYEAYRPLYAQNKIYNAYSPIVTSQGNAITGGWDPSWYVATGKSNHQEGYAIDVTLAKIINSSIITLSNPLYKRIELTVQECEMYTSIQEVSYLSQIFTNPVTIYSETAWQSGTQTTAFASSEPAKRLQKYMTDAGFAPLSSEWWHFNDVAARTALGDLASITGNWELTTNMSILPQSSSVAGGSILIKSDDYDYVYNTHDYPYVIALPGYTNGMGSETIITGNGYITDSYGNKLPAFCIEPEKPGVSETPGGSYSVTLDRKLTDKLEIALMKLSQRNDVSDILYPGQSGFDKEYWINYAIKIVIKLQELYGESSLSAKINSLYPTTDVLKGNYVPDNLDFPNIIISAIKNAYNWAAAHKNDSPSNSGNITITRLDGSVDELTHLDPQYSGNYEGHYKVEIDGGSDSKFKVKLTERTGGYFTDFKICDSNKNPVSPNYEFTNGDEFWIIGDLPELLPEQAYNIIHDIEITADGEFNEEYWIATPDDSRYQSYLFTVFSDTATAVKKFSVEEDRPEMPKMASLRIGKINSTTGQPVPGAKFTVEQIDGTYFNTITVGSDGYYTLDEIPEGSYKITEIYVPLPLIVDPVPKIIYIDPETATEDNPILIEFINDQMVCVHVYKYDSKTNELLNFAQFKLSRKDETSALFTGVTGESKCTDCGLCSTPCNGDGVICFGPLDKGWYTVSEINPPPGYIFDPATPSVQTFEVTGKEIQEIELKFDNRRRPELKIIKKDPEGNHLADVEFEIWKSGTQEKFSGKTDSNGEIYITWNNENYPLSEGSYSIREINVPAGYVLSDEVKEIMLVGNSLSEVVFVNPKRPELEILKVDTTGKPLANAVFIIKRAGTTTEYELITDNQGKILIPYDSPLYPLEPDRYIITEKQAPDHYILSEPNFQEITLEANTRKTLTFINPEKPKMTIEKYDRRGNGSGGLLPVTPVTFRIWKTDGSYDQTLTTDSSGKIRITDLMPGEYHIQETATKDGYILSPEVRTILLKGDDDVTVTFYNDKRPELLIVKLDVKTGKPLSGAHFQISKGDEVLFQDLVTNENGEILILYNDMHRLLEPGVYKVTEITAPPGYDIVLPASVNVVLREGEKTRVEFNDIRKPTLIITKRNALTLKPIPNTFYNIKWEDAYGGVHDLGNRYTDKNGQIILPFVEVGWYIITEIRPAPGMTAAKNPVTRIYLGPGANAYSYDELTDSQNSSGQTGNSTGPVSDSDRDNPYGNTDTSNGTGIIVWTPDNTGGSDSGSMINTGNGIIVWRPSTGYENAVAAPLNEPADIPAFEFCPDIEAMPDVFINGVNAVDINETVGEYKAVMLDTETVSEQIFTIEEITDRFLKDEFETYHNENYNIQTVRSGDIFIDDSGRQWKLEISNGTVKFVPVSSPKNIQLTAVNNNLNSGIGLSSMSASLTPLSPFMRSDISLLSDNDGEIIDFPLNAVIIKKTDAITGQLLAGATFELYRMSDEISGQNGTLLERFTTDNSGIIAFIGLPAGTYFVKEVKAPVNYTLNIQGVQTALFAPDSTTNIEFTFTNYPYGSILVDKVDAVTNKPLAGARFELKTSAGAHVAYGTTDNYGHILFSNVEPGSYIISEQEAPNGYQIDTQPQTVYVPADGKTYTVYFKNQPYGTLMIVKKDRETNIPISGVTFHVTDIHGANIGDITPGNGFAADGMYTTDNNGEIRIDHIPEGYYLITEVYAPDPYLIDDTPKVVFAEWGKIKTVEFWNSKTGALVISKYDAVTKEPLAGAIFMVTDSRGAVIGESAGLYTTDESGHVLIYDLEPGAYRVYEVQSPLGYILDNTVQTIHILNEKMYYLDFYDQPVNSFTIMKYDADTHEPLADTVFRITKLGSTKTIIGEYTTDVNGKITIDDLLPGSYEIEEIKAPPNYVLENTVQTIALEQNKPQVVTFHNHAYGNLLIVKRDEFDNHPLAGAEFTVSYANGAFYGNYATMADGAILIPNIEPGIYLIRETRAPSGYLLDNATKTVTVPYAVTTEVIFTNRPKSGIQIVKIDSETRGALSGAEFKLTRSNGEVIGVKMTDIGGNIIFDNLEPGTYIVTETRAPQGYVLDAVSQTAVVTSAKMTTVTFENRPLSGIQIIKKNSETGGVVAGAEFKITKSNGETVGTYTTDSSGTAIAESLIPGIYHITETKAPQYYVLNSTPQTVEVKSGKLALVEFLNIPYGSLVISKTDKQTGAGLEGAIFEVKKVSGELIGRFITGADGIVIVQNLVPGTYLVTEIQAPAGYEIDTPPQTIQVGAGSGTGSVSFGTGYPEGSASMSFVSNNPLGTLEVIKLDKVDRRKALQGATFELRKADGTYVDTQITDISGKVFFGKLPSGNYVITETVAPKGYEIDTVSKNITITAGNPASVTFYNNPYSSIEIIKTDAITHKVLSGAVFEVTRADGSKIGTYRTDSAGKIIVPNLEEDVYIISETVPPDGYILSEIPKTVVVTSGKMTQVEFTNKPLSGIQVIKLDAQTNAPLTGATFLIERDNGERIGTYRTDRTGKIIVPDLKEGTYIISETIAPDGYILDEAPKTVIVKSGKLTVVEFYNKPLAGLRIIKLDSFTHNPIEGVEFQINKINGEKVENDFRGYTFKTDRTGQIYIPDLPNGYYIVTETRAVDGYFLDGEPKTVLVQSGKTTILEVFNTPMSGLLIVKTDEMTGKPLAGVVYDIKRADGAFVTGNILDGNQPNTENNSPNKTTSPNGDITGSYTTDANGRILLNGLAAGQYNVTERKALDGYELDTNVYNVTVLPGKLTTIQLTNKPKSGLRLVKIDSVTKKPIYGVEFMLFDTNGKIVGVYRTDNNGIIDFPTDIPEGRYTIRETKAAAGYYIDEIPKTVDFTAGKVTEINWTNTPYMGQFQITKKSADANTINGFPKGKLLQGAIFEIYDRANNLVDTITSDKNGLAVSKTLPLGRYTIREVKAPVYYLTSQETINAEIEFAGQIVRLEVYNKSIYTNVSISKRGYAEVLPGQQIRYDFKDIANNSNVPLDSFYWRDTLPTNAVRLNKIITGTWSHKLNYKIVYKTNKKSDYRTLADNISSEKSRVIDASPAALGLASNEYVTEFMVVFGRVPAGFKQKDAPYIICDVLNDLPHEYRFTNKCDAGGLWAGKWIQSTDRWVTVVYNKTIPPKLPRTGY